jgi:hypothetical protein
MNALVTKATKLPLSYVEAQEAIEKCYKMDECKEWADKAAALASYAKQADDETLYVTAMKIKGRAIRRAGELLKEIEPKHTGRIPTGGDKNSETRTAIAEAAGFSARQQAQALQIASIPKREFERALGAEKPPTLTVLAKLGTKPRPVSTAHLHGRDPKDFNQALHARAELGRMAEKCQEVTPTVVVRGTLDRDYSALRDNAKIVGAWLAKLQAELAARKKTNK